MTPETLQINLMQREQEIYDFVVRHIPDGLKTHIVADDILQEIWKSAFRTCKHLREDTPNALQRWIFTIARRKVTDALRYALAKCRCDSYVAHPRDRSSFLTLLEHISGPQRTPSSEEAARESVHAVRAALNALPADYRQAIMLHHIEGRSHEEVAQVMKRTPSAVNSLMRRALRKLREQLGAPSRFFSDQFDAEDTLQEVASSAWAD